MVVIETNLTFGRLTRRKTTDRIVIHHTATGDVSAATLHANHRQRGWSGIGYHYLIRLSGAIERGRPEWSQGTHTVRFNATSIAIALTGNFSRILPQDVQIHSLINLVQDIQRRHGNRLMLSQHSDLSATECPGTHFPWVAFLARLDSLK